MHSQTAHTLKAVLGSLLLLSAAACGGGGGGSGGGGSGGGGGGGGGIIGGIGIFPIPILPIATVNRGVIAFTSCDRDGFSGSWGGQGTTYAGTHWNGTGDYTVTFTGTYPDVLSIDDVVVFATVEHADDWQVASASIDQSSADATKIIVRVFTYKTDGFPHLPHDAGFSVMVTRGPNALGIAGYANIEGEGVVPNVLHSGGNETTGVYAARNSRGHYTVTMDGNYPGATSMDDFSVFVTINDDDYLEVASASIDGGSADSTHVRFQVSAWTSVVIPPIPVDTSFSVLLLRKNTQPPGIRGFATVRGSASPTVVNFGGVETTSVSASQPSNGLIEVTFYGHFDGLTTLNDVTVLAAVADDDGFNVASIGFIAKTTTFIKVGVFVWTNGVAPVVLQDRDITIVIPK